ncbi:Dolichyl-phosphate-mannose-protein mannosyltransferase [uncultured archaeon]|nr:Dolichyl-phosphate-mannose-protein mannosyltransferase [uncultured archaeon]
MNNSIRAYVTKYFPMGSQNVLTFEVLFIILSSLIILIAEISTILATLKFFYSALVYAVIITIFFVLIFFLLKQKIRIEKLIMHDWIALSIVVLFGALNTYYFYDVFSGGLDTGVYPNAASLLASRHSFTVVENINFPGWVEIDNLHRLDFDYGYPTWLAINYSIFGLSGIQLSNFLPILIGTLSIYFIGKHSFNSKVGIFSVILIATTYPMFWITRVTLTEALAFGLLWFGILSFLFAYQRKNNLYLYPAILSMSFGLLTRPEFIPTYILAICILFFLFYIKNEKWIINKKITVCLVIAVLPFFIYTYLINMRYFSTMLSFLKDPSIIISPAQHVQQDIQLPGDPISSHYPEFVFHMLAEYNLYLFIIFIPLTFLVLRKFGKSMAINFIFIFILSSPSFIYLVHPSITLFQPWFLRRYIVAVIPLAIMSTVVFIHFMIRQKQVQYLIFGMILILNIVTASPIITLSENAGMIKHVGDISSKFTGNDMVIVDQYSSSYKIADPMFFVYGIETRLVNPTTFNEIIEEMSYSGHKNIYLITYNNSWIFGRINQSSLQFTFDHYYSFEDLIETVDIHHKYGTGSIIYYTAPYSEVMEMIEVPKERILVNGTFMVYRLTSLPSIKYTKTIHNGSS